jgi:hypothetical protein
MLHKKAIMAVAGLLFGMTSPFVYSQLNTTDIPYAPYGAGLDDSNGSPVALTDNSFLVPSIGPDGNLATLLDCNGESPDGTDDDVILLVTGVGGAVTVTPLATPYLMEDAGASAITVLTPTRALVASAGPDCLAGTGDELVYLLDDLGTANTVTPIPIGHMDDRSTWRPIRLSDNSAAVAWGDDHTNATKIALLTDLGGNNFNTTLDAPFTRHTAGQPVALSPTSLIIAMAVTEDQPAAGDKLYLFTDLGGTNTRTDIATPFLNYSRPGVPVPLGNNRIIIVSDGLDAERETIDDAAYMIDNIGTTNDVTTLSTPGIYRRGAGGPVALNSGLIVIGSIGPDEDAQTADDGLHIITDTGAGYSVSYLIVPGMDEDRGSQPVRMDDTSLIVGTAGLDLEFETADDALVMVSNVGTSNDIQEIVVGGLNSGKATQVTRVNDSTVVFTSGGADNLLGDEQGALDDVVNMITGLPGAPIMMSTASIGRVEHRYAGWAKPVMLGPSRVMLGGTGGDGAFGRDSLNNGASPDDVVIIVDLPISDFPKHIYECLKGGWKTFVDPVSGEKIFKNRWHCIWITVRKRHWSHH